MSGWGFSYVENLSWVLLQPNHAILRLPYPCLQRSHITLYIFRREGKRCDVLLKFSSTAGDLLKLACGSIHAKPIHVAG
jgi:hypothetical protein